MKEDLGEDRRCNPSRMPAACCCPSCCCVAARLEATQILLKDGRVLEGKLGRVGGLAVAPLAVGQDDGSPQLIIFLNDDLRRTYVSKYQVQKMLGRPARRDRGEVRAAPQISATGGWSRASVQPVRVDPFDEFGRRIFDGTN